MPKISKSANFRLKTVHRGRLNSLKLRQYWIQAEGSHRELQLSAYIAFMSKKLP